MFTPMLKKRTALAVFAFLLPYYSLESAQSVTQRALSLVQLVTSPITSPKLTDSILSCRRSILKGALSITAPPLAIGILANIPQLSTISFTTLAGTWLVTTALAIPPLGIQSFLQSPPKSARIYLGCGALLGVIGACAYRFYTLKLHGIEKDLQSIEATRLLTFNRGLQEAAKKTVNCKIDLTQAPTREFLAFAGYQPSQHGYKKLSNEPVKAEDARHFGYQRARFTRVCSQINELLKSSIVIGSLLITGHSLLLGMQKLGKLDRWIM